MWRLGDFTELAGLIPAVSGNGSFEGPLGTVAQMESFAGLVQTEAGHHHRAADGDERAHLSHVRA